MHLPLLILKVKDALTEDHSQGSLVSKLYSIARLSPLSDQALLPSTSYRWHWLFRENVLQRHEFKGGLTNFDVVRVHQ